MRYDTPTFAGFTLSGSIYSGSISSSGALDKLSVASGNSAAAPQQKYGTDLTLRYSGGFSGVKLLGAVTTNRLSKGNGGTTADDAQNMKVWDGSLSALHVNSGINATVNYAQKTLANPGLANAWGLTGADATGTVLPLNYPTKKPKFGRVALGLISNLNCYGSTNFIVDYTQTKNNFEDDGKGKAYGLGVVQQLKKVNSEVYVAVRQLKYSTPSISTIQYDKIFQAFAGIRVNFGGKLSTT
jgi:hypothetical protein